MLTLQNPFDGVKKVIFCQILFNKILVVGLWKRRPTHLQGSKVFCFTKHSPRAWQVFHPDKTLQDLSLCSFFPTCCFKKKSLRFLKALGPDKGALSFPNSRPLSDFMARVRCWDPSYRPTLTGVKKIVQCYCKSLLPNKSALPENFHCAKKDPYFDNCLIAQEVALSGKPFSFSDKRHCHHGSRDTFKVVQ